MIARAALGAVLLVLLCSTAQAQQRRERAASASKSNKAETADKQEQPVDTSDGEIRKEGDAEVKVYEFGGLDIEGQLRTPQMLYFLNRLRAEFGRPRLPHRSFMPELQRSTKGKAF